MDVLIFFPFIKTNLFFRVKGKIRLIFKKRWIVIKLFIAHLFSFYFLDDNTCLKKVPFAFHMIGQNVRTYAPNWIEGKTNKQIERNIQNCPLS